MANDQVYQAPVEVAITPDDADARFYQAPVEVAITLVDPLPPVESVRAISVNLQAAVHRSTTW